MKFRFDPRKRLVVVIAELEGPSGKMFVRLALDTGTTYTLISSSLLVAVGYDPAASVGRVEITTASSVEYAVQLPVSRLKALGQERQGFPVLAHSLPSSASVDGLLGLDFFRGYSLSIDFRTSEIELD
jgi:predicted aspartyl protease